MPLDRLEALSLPKRLRIVCTIAPIIYGGTRLRVPTSAPYFFGAGRGSRFVSHEPPYWP